MTPEEYRTAIAQLGMSVARAGRFFCVTQSTAYEWASEGCRNAPVVMWLRFMIVLNVTPDWVDYWLGRDTSKKD